MSSSERVDIVRFSGYVRVSEESRLRSRLTIVHGGAAQRSVAAFRIPFSLQTHPPLGFVPL